MSRKLHIASCSGGKDSVATLLVAAENNEPLDGAIYSEVMFSKDISGEVPEHRDFVYNVLKPFCEKTLGIPFTILRAKKTYEDVFHHIIVSGPHMGEKRGFVWPGITKKIIPYFDEHHPGLKLRDVKPKHIQDYYTYEMNVNGVSANTVLHRHANIRKALQYAYKTDIIVCNPADKIEKPRKAPFVAGYYTIEELGQLFSVVKGDPAELGVILAAFYGLRRSEALGLKWDAIDFENKRITIRHIVTEASEDGKSKIVKKDRTKTQSSYRSLPLIPPFEAYLRRLKEEQENNRKLCGNAYCTRDQDYIYVNPIGELVKPGYLTTHVPALLQKKGMKRIRFHDLRHSCASLLFACGVSLKEIQAWLGHSTLATTADIYTHMDENAKLATVNTILKYYPV